MRQIIQFYTGSYPTKKEVTSSLVYANTHDCIVELRWFDSSEGELYQRIFPGESIDLLFKYFLCIKE